MKGIIIRRGCFARPLRYTLYLGIEIHGLLLSRASPSQLYVKRLTQRQDHNPSQLYISSWPPSVESHFPCSPHTYRSGWTAEWPTEWDQTSCESVPWGIRWGRAGLLRLLSRGPMPCESTQPCQRWCPNHLAVYGVRPTLIRAELELQPDLSVGPGGSAPTRPTPP